MSSPTSSPRTPSALRNELAAAKRAVEVLKAEKQNADEKLEKLHAVLEKERNALRDVLSAARTKVDELEKIKKEQQEEIERLRKLLAEQQGGGEKVTLLEKEILILKQTITKLENDLRSHTSMLSDRDRTITDLRSQLSSLQGMQTGNQNDQKMIADLRQQLLDAQRIKAEMEEAHRRQMAELREQLAASRETTPRGFGADPERLLQQIKELQNSLTSCQKTMREQVESHRQREAELREQLNTQRSESQTKIQKLEAQIRELMNASNAQLLERLQRQVKEYRQHASLRMFNAMLQRHHLVMRACMFWGWQLITKGESLQRRLTDDCKYQLDRMSADCEYKLKKLRETLTPGLGGPFANTPLRHSKHMITRNLGTPQRFDKWEQMSPRSGTGDGVCTLSPRSKQRANLVSITPTGRSFE